MHEAWGEGVLGAPPDLAIQRGRIRFALDRVQQPYVALRDEIGVASDPFNGG